MLSFKHILSDVIRILRTPSLCTDYIEHIILYGETINYFQRQEISVIYIEFLFCFGI